MNPKIEIGKKVSTFRVYLLFLLPDEICPVEFFYCWPLHQLLFSPYTLHCDDVTDF